MTSQLFGKYKIAVNRYLKTLGLNIYIIDNNFYVKNISDKNLLSDDNDLCKKLVNEISYVIQIYESRYKNTNLYNNISNLKFETINRRELILDILTEDLIKENRELENDNEKLRYKLYFNDSDDD